VIPSNWICTKLINCEQLVIRHNDTNQSIKTHSISKTSWPFMTLKSLNFSPIYAFFQDLIIVATYPDILLKLFCDIPKS
jgi:hypothetical protein